MLANEFTGNSRVKRARESARSHNGIGSVQRPGKLDQIVAPFGRLGQRQEGRIEETFPRLIGEGLTLRIQHFAAGAQLIQQGDDAEHVFIIIEGHAEAFVDGQKVGDVQKDEIFGAMAVFTREKRSASVIASEPCTVMVIPKDQFLSLMQSNPRIAHSLIEGMARRIDLLNKEVTQLRLQRQAE